MIMCFNSTLVRLKRRRVGNRLRLLYKFQFHACSIKAIRTTVSTSAGFSFQFHAGSIKALAQIEDAKAGKTCFNSTLVRLKPGARVALPMRGWPCFNSTLVRLKQASLLLVVWNP